MSSSEAFVILATNDGYALGALVLAQSIRNVGTKRKLVVLISQDLSDSKREILGIYFDEMVSVDQLIANNAKHLNPSLQSKLKTNLIKINCWLLVRYSKCVFLDSDCLVLKSIDDLFQSKQFSAAPDTNWPDCFNSGVFVYEPSVETFIEIMALASYPNFPLHYGEQYLLNRFIKEWHKKRVSQRLSFVYNVNINVFNSNSTFATLFQGDIRVIRFVGPLRPWQLTFNHQTKQLSGSLTGPSDIQKDFLLRWWKIMDEHVWPIQHFNQQSGLNNETINQQGQFEGSLDGTLNYGNLTDNNGIESNFRTLHQAGNASYLDPASLSNNEQQLQWDIDQHYPS